VLFASPVLPLQNLLRGKFGYPWALCSFETLVIVSLLLIFWFGPEKRGRSFHQTDRSEGLPSNVAGSVAAAVK
jgi:MFS transporter, SHS family, lactate transporter